MPSPEHSDWFVVAIQDRGSDGNPDIDIAVETDPWSGYLQMEVFISCESGQILELNCSNGTAAFTPCSSRPMGSSKTSVSST